MILAAGYMPQAIVDYFGDGSQLGMKVTYVIEETPLGTAGALKNVEQHITGPFFVLNGDILTSLDLRAMREYHQQKGGIGALHLIQRRRSVAVRLRRARRNRHASAAFVEKPPKGQEPTNEINAGTYLLEREILDFIPAESVVSIERETFPQIIAAGKALYAYTTDDYWIDLGRPEQYLAAHRDVLSGAMPLAVEPGLSGNGSDVLRGPSRHHSAGSCRCRRRRRREREIGPNVVLGKGCSIGAGAVDARIGALGAR